MRDEHEEDAAGATAGGLQTWAANPNAGIHEYAFSVGLGGAFGALMPYGSFGSLGGTIGGAGIGAAFGDARMGAQVGGLVGGIAGGGWQYGLRAAAWEAGGALIGAGYGYYGDAEGALFGANLGMFAGGIAGGIAGRVGAGYLGRRAKITSEAEGVTLTIREPRILSRTDLSDAEAALLRKHFRIKSNAIHRAARRGQLKWSPGTDEFRIAALQATHRTRVAERFERMFGKPLDMDTLNADHLVDLIVGGAVDQRLRMLNESINKSFGALLLQAGRKANLQPGQAIKDIVILSR